MNRTEQSKAAYNNMAHNYTNTREGQFTAAFKQALVRMVPLNPAATVLDVACGNGDLLGMLAEKNPISGYGMDLAENMVAEAKKRHPRFQFVVGESGKLPFANAFFDVVTVSAAFHHFEQPGLFLQEAQRTLKPKGCLFIAELYWPTVLRVLVNPFLPLLNAGDVKIYSPKELEKLLGAHGFTRIQNTRQQNIQIIRGVAE